MGVIDQVALNVEHRPLFEAGAHLVHTDDADVRLGIHRPRREIVVEGQVGTPGFVDDERFTSFVTDPRDALDVRQPGRFPLRLGRQ